VDKNPDKSAYKNIDKNAEKNVVKNVAKKPSPGKLGVTRGKLVLIAVLGVVLLAVVYMQFGSSADSTTESVATGFGPHIRATATPAGAATTDPPPATAALPTATPAVATSLGENKNEQLPPAQLTSRKSGFSSDWQGGDIAKVVLYDPFALPASFPQRLKAGEEEKLAKETVNTEDAKAEEAARAEAIKVMQTEFVQLQHEGVRVIMQKQDQYVALVGERTLHVGDEINGFKVVSIGADGVRVARDLKQ
jgi:hypothetical protein